MSIRSQFPDLPPVWGMGILLLQWLVSASAPLARFGERAQLAGAILIGTGLLLAAWAALWFLRRRTPIEPGERPRTLIVEGPFRLNRNPIYTGMTVVLIGSGLVFGTLAALLVAMAFPLIIDRRFVVREEASLRAAFGAAADRYFARTRRW